MQSSTVREFDGGWNVIDEDLNLATRFSVRLRNMFRSSDGSIALRFGTKLFAELAGVVSGNIVNVEYFSNNLVVVMDSGEIAAVDGQGGVAAIWNTAIAFSRKGRPVAWGVTPFCCFAFFKGELYITNGFDKPLIVRPNLVVNYLADLATGSNVNTPITRFVCSHDRYVVMIGSTNNPTLLSISAADAGGTWLNDPAPNDAVEQDLAAFLTIENQTVKGILSTRNGLVIMFDEQTLVLEIDFYLNLGTEIQERFPPKATDTIYQYGTVSHRAIQMVGEDVLFADNVGVPTLQRGSFTSEITPIRASQLIDPEIQAALRPLSIAALEDRVFSVYHKIEGQYMLFVPNDSRIENQVQTRGFMFTSIKSLRITAWSEITGWNWSAGARSKEGFIFFAKGTQIYLYGDRISNPIYRDFIGDQETYSDDTVHTDGTGFSPVADENDSGVPIAFEWELPWTDLKQRGNIKRSRYITMDTTGTAPFTLSMFIDNIYEDREDGGETFTDNTLFDDDTGFEREYPLLNPALSMELLGGDAEGFGSGTFGNNFGAGRMTQDERLYAWPSKFKLAKFRVEGEALEKLKIISLTLHHATGGIRRG